MVGVVGKRGGSNALDVAAEPDAERDRDSEMEMRATRIKLSAGGAERAEELQRLAWEEWERR